MCVMVRWAFAIAEPLMSFTVPWIEPPPVIDWARQSAARTRIAKKLRGLMQEYPQTQRIVSLLGQRAKRGFHCEIHFCTVPRKVSCWQSPINRAFGENHKTWPLFRTRFFARSECLYRERAKVGSA